MPRRRGGKRPGLKARTGNLSPRVTMKIPANAASLHGLVNRASGTLHCEKPVFLQWSVELRAVFADSHTSCLAPREAA